MAIDLSVASAIGAITAVGVAAWQGYLQQQALRHSLYEKRIRIYQETLRYLNLCIESQGRGGHDISKMREAYYEAELLFRNDVVVFMFEIVKRGCEAAILFSQIDMAKNSNSSHDRTEIRQQKLEVELKWLRGAFVKMKNLCKPHLQISDGSAESLADVFFSEDAARERNRQMIGEL